jgi:uncharacterized protein YbaP (TraB family)
MADVFLFGQFPLPKGISWLTPEIERAFAESKDVWFENPDFDPRTAGAAIQKRADLGGPKVVEAVSAEDRKRIGDLLSGHGRPTNMFDDEMLVWQAYIPLTDFIDTIARVDPPSIPERVLRPRAKAEGKAIRSEWASMEEIMEFSSQQTPEQQLQLISKTLDEARPPEQLRAEGEAWARGDISQSAARSERFRAAYPALSERLVTLRNKRWVPRIQQMLARGGSTFVCVGLGHLVGPESIQRQLAQVGLDAQRI